MDFNKLTLGSARHKLFVGPITGDTDADLSILVTPATYCAGNVYAAFVAHPDLWGGSGRTPTLYRFDRRIAEWLPVVYPHDC